jgi:hypothetical protein
MPGLKQGLQSVRILFSFVLPPFFILAIGF